MGFLGKRNKTTAPNLGTTVISQGTTFIGELTLDAKLHIDGHFEGTVTSTSDVSIGASGHFEGTITANCMLVSGYAKGKFECERLEIIESGRVIGDVLAEDFVIEPGGRFVGGSRSRSDEPVAALSHMESAETAATKPKPAEEKAAVEPTRAAQEAKPEAAKAKEKEPAPVVVTPPPAQPSPKPAVDAAASAQAAESKPAPELKEAAVVAPKEYGFEPR